MKLLRLEIRTPQEVVVDREAESVVVSLADGWLGIQPGHAPFVARVTPGEVVVRAAGQTETVATIGGLLAVAGDRVTLLTGAARRNCDLDQLEREIDDETRQLAAMETEAERHFDRVLRQAAATFAHQRRPRP